MKRPRTMGMSFHLKPKTVEVLSRARQARSLGGPRLVSFSELIDEAVLLAFGARSSGSPAACLATCPGCGYSYCSGEYTNCWGAGKTGLSSSS